MFYFLSKSFWGNPWLVMTFIITLLVIIFLRYVGTAYLYNSIIQVITKSSVDIYKTKKIQIAKEVKWSLLSSVVFTVFCVICFWAYQHELTMIYDHVLAFPVWYFCISPFLLLILYETYYYWLHRWMHRPSVFRIVHKVHHQSIHSTVFTSFSFHPIEATLQFLFFPLVIFFMPVHYSILLLVLIVITLSAVVNHSGIEIYNRPFLLKNLIGSSHHHLHHTEFKTNFGLYFTWWDKWMKTESKTLIH